MVDSVTQVANVSIFGKIMESIKGVVFGLGLFVLAFPLIFLNECNSVTTARKLASGQEVVVEVSSEAVDPAHEGALVQFSGEARTSEVLQDANFGVSVPAIKLRRNVEMYQWKETSDTETRDKVGGGEERVTVYSYETVWSETPIDSSRFNQPAGHANPSTMPYETTQYVANNVSVGAFSLFPDLIDQMNTWQALTVDEAMSATLPQALRGTWRAANGTYYRAVDPSRPVVGDLRVAFEVVQPGTVSVVAEQRGTGTQTWTDPGGNGTIAMLSTGQKSADEMFDAAEAANRTLTWILRLVGFGMMWIGLALVLRPISVVAGVVPFFGRAVSLFAGLIAGVLALGFWSVTVAAAWLAVRPILAIVLFIVAGIALVGAIALGVMLARAVRNQRAEAVG